MKYITKLQIVRHALKNYITRPKANEFDLNRERQLLNEVETKIAEAGRVSSEEKYKLALFSIIRNCQVMPYAQRHKWSMKEINQITLLTLEKFMANINYENLRKVWEDTNEQRYIDREANKGS